MKKVFLGSNEHLLDLASDYLIENYASNEALNLKNISLVVMGSKTHKRLLEILLLKSEKRGISFIPPRAYTQKGFFDYVVNFSNNNNTDYNKKLINDFQSLLVFIKVINDNISLIEETIYKKNSLKNDSTSIISLAQKIFSLYKEISSANLSFEDIPSKAKMLESFSEDNRWLVLSKIYDEYKKNLEKLNFTDIIIERKNFLNSTKDGSLALGADTVLINIPDINPIFCDILKKISSPIAHLIYAPQTKGEAFDEFGNVKVDKWLLENIDINDENIILANSPRELGKIVSNLIIKASKDYASNDIVIGSTDDSIISSIKQAAENKNLKVVSVREKNITSTPIYYFIELLQNYAKMPTYTNFANLIRHGDILNYIVLNNPLLNKKDILVALDEYNENHLPYMYRNLKNDCIVDERSNSDKIVKEVSKLLDELILNFNERKSLSSWSEDVLNILIKLYGEKKISRVNDKDNVLLTTYSAYKTAILNLNNKLFETRLKFTLQDALMLLNNLVRDTSLGAILDDDAVEIQGWLEIQNDDAEFVILAGLKEGTWPESINQDEFLPNSLRKVLGLIDNDFRLARDIFMTKSILSSKKQVYFVPLKYDLFSENTNLLSKILLMTSSQKQAKRLLSFYKEASEPNAENNLANNLTNNLDDDNEISDIEFFSAPNVAKYDLNKISVSALKVYKECPYKFYLQYYQKNENDFEVLEAKTNINELDALKIGTLLHDVLDSFGKSLVKDSIDEKEIFTFLSNSLKIYINNNFGKNCLPAINIQVIGIENIFKDFSKWQAKRAKEGWQIVETEKSLEDFYLNVDDKKVKITGRIDRLDYNKKDNLSTIIDYKSSSSPTNLSKIYSTTKKTWLDYQMPLYLEYFLRNKKMENISFAYLNLYDKKEYFYEIPKDSQSKIGEQELENAILETKELIRQIRKGVFWPPNKYSLDELNAFS